MSRCQAFITNIEREHGNGWGKTEPSLVDPLIPEWAATPDGEKYKPRDIPPRVEFFVNVLSSEAVNNRLWLSVFDPTARLRDESGFPVIFANHGRYRTTVMMTGDNVKPKRKYCIVKWEGHWRFKIPAS